jgi:hypothetical protein
MMNLSQRKLVVMAFFAVLAVFTGVVIAGDNDPIWRPITPEELQMKLPRVEPDADAEAIFWEVRVDDKKLGKLSYSHYVRVKIFTERGRERFSKMDIPFTKGRKIENVAARVVKPDGSVVQLKAEDIFEREIAKAGKARVLAKSFAVPGIEPGVIVEYQYSESIKNDSASGERLIFQRDIPLQKVSYYVRPYGNSTLAFNTYNMPETKFVDDRKGFSVGTMYDVPAFKEEPYMPPNDEVRKWVYLSYRSLGTIFQWAFVSLDWQVALGRLSKPNKEVKAKAAELTAGMASDEEKLRKIYAFVQRDIKNISFDRTLTEEQIEKINVKDGDDALRRGMGNSFHVDMLFASLARAAGFETSIVLAGDRSENFFSAEKYPFPSFIEMAGIAVKVDNQWRYFDACTPFLPFGSLTWNRENVRAMLIGDKGYLWITVPMSDHMASPAKRTGRFSLSGEGTLEGSVKIEYGGHQAIGRRREEYRDSQSKREENIKKEIMSRISTAEISDLVISNFEDNTKPLSYTFKVRVPNYAQKAGRRLILQPGFFEHGSDAVFTSATRTYSIYFPYPWSEEDDIDIQLPVGFALDNPDAPGEVKDSKGIARLKIGMSVNQAGNVLSYKRSFHFGGGGTTLFPASSYQPLKGLFDAFHRADTHAVSIRQTAP